ncbi:hypothetical protein Scep_026241 [Stephania cephalantha]|uniref:Uncharacterized protein n=1 Tax=Stephania cephalantha TaxID=152367 RepID=A0AAP0EQ14_9MAGN
MGFVHVAARDWLRELKTTNVSRADRLDLLLMTLCVEDMTRGSKRLAETTNCTGAGRIGRRHVSQLENGLSFENSAKKGENVQTRIRRHILRQLKCEKIVGELDVDDMWTNRLLSHGCALTSWANQRLPRDNELEIAHIVRMCGRECNADLEAIQQQLNSSDGIVSLPASFGLFAQYITRGKLSGIRSRHVNTLF